MAIWYSIHGDSLQALLDALTAHGVETEPIVVDGETAGCRCTMQGVETTLEFYRDTAAESLSVVRHEGIHVLHPIRFHRLNQAILKSLEDVDAEVEE